MSDHVRAYKTFFASPPCIYFSPSLYPINSAPSASLEASFVYITQVRSHFFTLPVSALLNVCIVQCTRGARITKTRLQKTEIQGLCFSSRV